MQLLVLYSKDFRLLQWFLPSEVSHLMKTDGSDHLLYHCHRKLEREILKGHMVHISFFGPLR